MTASVTRVLIFQKTGLIVAKTVERVVGMAVAVPMVERIRLIAPKIARSFAVMVSALLQKMQRVVVRIVMERRLAVMGSVALPAEKTRQIVALTVLPAPVGTEYVVVPASVFQHVPIALYRLVSV